MESQVQEKIHHNSEIEGFIQLILDYNLNNQIANYFYAIILFFIGCISLSHISLGFFVMAFFVPPQVYIFIFPKSKEEAAFVARHIGNHMNIVEEQKIKLMDSFSHLLILGCDDLRTLGIDPVRISIISQEIESLSNSVKNLQNLLSDFNKNIKKERVFSTGLPFFVFRLLLWHYSHITKKFIHSQKTWLIKEIPLYSKTIKDFLEYHANELRTLDTSICAQSEVTENRVNQWALEFQTARLEKHIDNLEKVRVNIY